MDSFSDRVYKATKTIPRGYVTTYKLLAQSISTKAYRAVGQSLSKNPHPLTIPCHRVIRSDRRVGGYLSKKNSAEKLHLLKQEGVAFDERGRVKTECIIRPKKLLE